MKILVTGGAGFIASHIVDRLIEQGHDVVVVDNLSTGHEKNVNSQAQFYKLDIRDQKALASLFELERPEIVDHHAAQTDVTRSMSDPNYDAEVNILGALNLLQLSVKYRICKFIFASTSAAYPEPLYLPADEGHPVQPLCAYGITKYSVEQYLYLYRHECGLNYTAFRYGNVYGPRQDPHGESGVVAIFSEQILNGIQPTLFGDGHKTRDYIYVSDVVAANLAALNGAGEGEVFNLGWGLEITDFEVFDAVRTALRVHLVPRYAAKRPGELDRISLDVNKARVLLGWKPRVTFEEGIRRTVNYYKKCHKRKELVKAFL